MELTAANVAKLYKASRGFTGRIPRDCTLKKLGIQKEVLLAKFKAYEEELASSVDAKNIETSKKIWLPERGITATVFGAGGFLGRYVCQNIGAAGVRAYIPNRGCEMELRHLKPMFDQYTLGQVAFPFYHPNDDDSIRRALEKSDIVINMIGKYYQTKHVLPFLRKNGKESRINYTFHDMNVDIPSRIARIAKELGIERMVHVSALASDVNSPSDWARTKAEGEAAVRSIFPDAVIVRPSIMFGPEDRFLNWFATAAEKYPFVPLVNGGSPLVQPVYVQDVAKAVALVVQDDQWDGRTLDLAGKEDYTWKEVAQFVYDITGQKVRLINFPANMAEKLGEFSQQLPGPVWTKDIAIQQTVDNVLDPVTPNVTFEDLGIQPEIMERVAFHWLHRFREGGHFLLTQGYHSSL